MNVQSMTVDELRNWLEGNGIPESHCRTFEGERCSVLCQSICLFLTE